MPAYSSPVAASKSSSTPNSDSKSYLNNNPQRRQSSPSSHISLPSAPSFLKNSFPWTSSDRNVSSRSSNNDSNSSYQDSRFYFTRQVDALSAARISFLPPDENWVGIKSPWAWLWALVFALIPFSYLYIGFVVLREACLVLQPPQNYYKYLPHFMADFIVQQIITSRRRWSVEIWCGLEALFFIAFKLQIRYLQTRDTLEASLSAAPLMSLQQRETLWNRIMQSTVNPVAHLQGWFFDESIHNMSQYDVRDFVTWSMFEGRHQEHLTYTEQEQLDRFLIETEVRISLFLYGKADESGEVDEGDTEEKENGTSKSQQYLAGNVNSLRFSSSTEENRDEKVDLNEDGNSDRNSDIDDGDQEMRWSIQNEVDNSFNLEPEKDDSFRSTLTEEHPECCQHLARPKKYFHFQKEQQLNETNDDETNFFSHLYEAYRTRYEQMHPVQDLQNMVRALQPPVQEFRNLMAETRQHIYDAEESAKATASQMYNTLVPTQMDKQFSAMSHATYQQLTDAWQSVKDKIEQVRFLSKQRQRLRQQLKGYRVMLHRMLDDASAVPSKQMAVLMRQITECHSTMERLEKAAQSAFQQASGCLPTFNEPHRYAKYSADPLLGIATYPLGFIALLLAATELPLRYMLYKRGFERRRIGQINYYYFPGLAATDDFESEEKAPLVFVHGIGIGLISYMPLINALIQTGRPILLPEIPYVSGFRPWQSPYAVLQPAVVCSTMTAMLATHGYFKATWVGHSYGTTWLSYMCQYASHAVAALVFLDPICFCLNIPRLTKSFVYSAPDPGTIAYVVRTDIIVNWTIQRSFPWAWIILFREQIDVPCAIFLSEDDALVPAQQVEDYFKRHDVPIQDKSSASMDFFENNRISTTVFRGEGHGQWTEQPASSTPLIVQAVEQVSLRAEQEQPLTPPTPRRER